MQDQKCIRIPTTSGPTEIKRSVPPPTAAAPDTAADEALALPGEITDPLVAAKTMSGQ